MRTNQNEHRVVPLSGRSCVMCASYNHSIGIWLSSVNNRFFTYTILEEGLLSFYHWIIYLFKENLWPLVLTIATAMNSTVKILLCKRTENQERGDTLAVACCLLLYLPTISFSASLVILHILLLLKTRPLPTRSIFNHVSDRLVVQRFGKSWWVESNRVESNLSTDGVRPSTFGSFCLWEADHFSWVESIRRSKHIRHGMAWHDILHRPSCMIDWLHSLVYCQCKRTEQNGTSTGMGLSSFVPSVSLARRILLWHSINRWSTGDYH